jgi:hypothetical protein
MIPVGLIAAEPRDRETGPDHSLCRSPQANFIDNMNVLDGSA